MPQAWEGGASACRSSGIPHLPPTHATWRQLAVQFGVARGHTFARENEGTPARRGAEHLPPRVASDQA